MLKARPAADVKARPNLDYLPFNNTAGATQPLSPQQPRSQAATQNSRAANLPAANYQSKTSTITSTEWEALLGSLDGGQTNLYDAIYGGPTLSLADSTATASSSYSDWSPQSWDMTALTMHDFTNSGAGPAHSVLSFSEESLSPSDDRLSASASATSVEPGMRGGGGPAAVDFKHQQLLPGMAAGDGYLLDGLDETFETFGL